MHRTLAVLLAVGLSATAYGQPKAQPDRPAEKQAKPAGRTLAEMFPDKPLPDLTIGSKAPDLKIAEFMRGQPVSGFEKGRVYVVEFWATWCGPCIMAFPHLAELQAKHADKVTVIGVNIWENSKGEEREQLIRDFVAEHDEMAYTVALEEGTAMADTWMKPAGRNGIPSAFIVDGEGRIAWVGHPMSMDTALASIIGGDYDLGAARKALQDEQRMMAAYNAMRRAVGEKSWDYAHEVAAALVTESFAENAMGLNAVAWILSQPEDATKACYELAHKAATSAAEQTEWNEWSVLSTVAQTSYRVGDKAAAAKWLNKSIDLAPAEIRPELTERLAEYGTQG